ncbi:MAG: sugar phosphate nucleotidyltransferase [Chitinophagaceae bacterium]
MKAIIPVAGAGTRLRPHTYTQPKALIPIAGKPILSFIVDPLAEAGITEFIFVIGYLGDKIIDYVAQKYPRLHCHFVQQNLREGSGQAIALTKEIIGDNEVFIVMGDTICEFNVKDVLDFKGSTLGLKKVDDPRNFGVAELDDQYFITRVVEKPQIPKSNMALVGLYKIKESRILFECLEENLRQKVKSHDEYQLTDALECMIEKKVKFSSFKVNNWFDCGRKDSLLETNSILLKKNDNVKLPDIPYDNTIIIPPVSIAGHCNIKNSIIGPNVTIGDNTVIKYSIIKNSIIGSYSNLTEVVLNSSIIGSDANIHGLTQSLNIGDNTEIDLG